VNFSNVFYPFSELLVVRRREYLGFLEIVEKRIPCPIRVVVVELAPGIVMPFFCSRLMVKRLSHVRNEVNTEHTNIMLLTKNNIRKATVIS